MAAVSSGADPLQLSIEHSAHFIGIRSILSVLARLHPISFTIDLDPHFICE